MFASSLRLVLFSSLALVHIQSTSALYVPIREVRDLLKRAVAYYDPAAGGGSMLTDSGNGFGEPLNVRSLFSTCQFFESGSLGTPKRHAFISSYFADS